MPQQTPTNQELYEQLKKFDRENDAFTDRMQDMMRPIRERRAMEEKIATMHPLEGQPDMEQAMRIYRGETTEGEFRSHLVTVTRSTKTGNVQVDTQGLDRDGNIIEGAYSHFLMQGGNLAVLQDITPDRPEGVRYSFSGDGGKEEAKKTGELLSRVLKNNKLEDMEAYELSERGVELNVRVQDLRSKLGI